jgi:hypothetical protein
MIKKGAIVMKYIYAILASAVFVSINVNAVSYYEMMQQQVNNFGGKISAGIERIDNVPIVDKLTNLLPFAMVAACFKECPGQTMIVLTGLLIYVFFQNEKFRSIWRKYNVLGGATHRSIKNQPQFDDSLFIFEGDDEEDAQEQEDNEEELLSDEESTDAVRSKKIVEHTPLNFI